MTRKLTRAAIVGSALIATLTLAACSGTGPDNAANTNPKPASPPAIQPAPDVVPDPDEAIIDPAASIEVGLHDVYTYDDGTTVQITDIKRQDLSEYATGGSPSKHDNLLVTIKMTAGKAGLYNPMDADANLTYGEDGVIAEDTSDSTEDGTSIGDGMSGAPGRLAPGRSLTGTWGFAVPDAGTAAVVLAFQPNTFTPTHGEAIFVGNA